MNSVVLGLPGNERMARSLADACGADLGSLEVRRFPDGESYVRIDTPVADRPVVLVCTLDRPDEKMLALLFATATAKDLGASRVHLVAPYLAYMRQDRRFRDGEALTSAYFARQLSNWVDGLVTVDPHLHRRSSLSEIYTIPTVTLHTATLLSSWVREHVNAPLVVGPDVESEQWVAAVARNAEAPYIVLRKLRTGDRDVTISVPDVSRWHDRTPVLIDDIISTARTMIETVGHLRRADLRAPVCLGVHAVFAGSAYDDLLAAGAERVVTCDTITHPSNGVSVAGLLANGLRELKG